jgi:hypothetical protein
LRTSDHPANLLLPGEERLEQGGGLARPIGSHPLVLGDFIDNACAWQDSIREGIAESEQGHVLIEIALKLYEVRVMGIGHLIMVVMSTKLGG